MLWAEGNVEPGTFQKPSSEQLTFTPGRTRPFPLLLATELSDQALGCYKLWRRVGATFPILVPSHLPTE